MNSCDPVDSFDPLPNNESRVDRLARWLVEGRGQRILAAREHALRSFKAYYGRPPTTKQWSAAWRIAGGGQ